MRWCWEVKDIVSLYRLQLCWATAAARPGRQRESETIADSTIYLQAQGSTQRLQQVVWHESLSLRGSSKLVHPPPPMVPSPDDGVVFICPVAQNRRPLVTSTHACDCGVPGGLASILASTHPRPLYQ